MSKINLVCPICGKKIKWYDFQEEESIINRQSCLECLELIQEDMTYMEIDYRHNLKKQIFNN